MFNHTFLLDNGRLAGHWLPFIARGQPLGVVFNPLVGMKLVGTFACYPGLHMLHEIATQGGGPLIPVWNVPGCAIVSPLSALAAGPPAAAGRLRKLYLTQPDSRGGRPGRKDRRSVV